MEHSSIVPRVAWLVCLIVGLYKRVRATGGQVNVVGARDQPLAIFKLPRMDRVFGL